MTPPQGSESVLILVVERDPFVRKLEAYFLSQAGYRVHFVEDGSQALEQVHAMKPDVVITELLVPKLDGLGLCRALKGDSATAGVAVIIFSFLAAQERAKEAGADCFLLKPLSDERLIAAIQEILHGTNHHTKKKDCG